MTGAFFVRFWITADCIHLVNAWYPNTDDRWSPLQSKFAINEVSHNAKKIHEPVGASIARPLQKNFDHMKSRPFEVYFSLLMHNMNHE